MNIGEKIIDVIIRGVLCKTSDPYEPIVWSDNAAEQLEAVVEAEIAERNKTVVSRHVKIEKIALALQSEFEITHRAGGVYASAEFITEFIQRELRRQADVPGIRF
jgi:hypothetical protein